MAHLIKPCSVVLNRIDVTQYRDTGREENSTVRNNIVDGTKKQSEATVSYFEDVNERNPVEIVQSSGLTEDDSDDDDEIALSTFLLASSYFLTQNSAVCKRKKRSVWVKEWYAKRNNISD